MSALSMEPTVEVDEATDFLWRVVRPLGTSEVFLELGTLFGDWDADELQPVIQKIAEHLQVTASVLLSNVLEESE